MGYKGIPLEHFIQYLFDNPHEARQAAEILAAILRARSARLTEIAAQMRGSFAAAYKRLQRFLQHTDPRLALWRLLPDDAPLVIGDAPKSPVLKPTTPRMWAPCRTAAPRGFGP